MDVRQTALLSGFFVSLFLLYAVYRAGKGPADGKLRFGYWMPVVGIVCVVIVLAAVFSIAFDPAVRSDTGELIAAVVAVVLFGSGASYCLIQFFYTRGTYDDEGIEYATLWGGPVYGRWDDLRTLKYDHRGRSFTLKFRGGTTIRFSSMMTGYVAVLDIVSRHQGRVR